jgi:hypothetical protein
MNGPEHSQPDRRPRLWNLEPREAAMLAGILVTTALIYMPSLRNGWVFDDLLQIVGADPLHSWTGIAKSFFHDSWWFQNPAHLPQSFYYRPFQTTWFGLNWLILGNHPAAWHFEKIVLELIVVMLCFRLAQLLTGSKTIALLAAGFFAVLPANTEPVAWASAIGEPLVAIFEMGALCCFINRKPGSGMSRGLKLALMLYAAALLSHESAILFPLIVAAYVFLLERIPGGEDSRSLQTAADLMIRARAALRAAAPFLVPVIALLCVRMSLFGAHHLFGMPRPQPAGVYIGWEKPVTPPGLRDLIWTEPVALLAYAGMLIVPGIAGPAHEVGWIYSVAPITFISAGVLASLAAIAWALAWRSSWRNLYLFCAAWSFLTMAPALNLIPLFPLVEDRYLYVPSFGWSLAVATAAVHLAAVSPRARAAVTGAMAVLLAAYAISGVRLERYWHDDLTYFAGCVAYDPHNMYCLRTLVEDLDHESDYPAAVNVLQDAVNRDPDNPYLHMQLLNQYALMPTGAEYFRAEIARRRALRARALAAAAAHDAPTAIPSP